MILYSTMIISPQARILQKNDYYYNTTFDACHSWKLGKYSCHCLICVCVRACVCLFQGSGGGADVQPRVHPIVSRHAGERHSVDVGAGPPGTCLQHSLRRSCAQSHDGQPRKSGLSLSVCPSVSVSIQLLTMPICPPVCQSSCLSVHLLTLPAYPSVSLSAYLSICSPCHPTHLSLCLPVSPSAHLACLPTCLPLRLSVHLLTLPAYTHLSLSLCLVSVHPSVCPSAFQPSSSTVHLSICVPACMFLQLSGCVFFLFIVLSI